MVPVEDTALVVMDTGGPGAPVVYLNGQFATQGYWRRVTAELGAAWRHITYDERARGRSERSADYSFQAAVRDVDAVLAARGVGTGPLSCDGPTERSSQPIGPAAVPSARWARSWLVQPAAEPEKWTVLLNEGRGPPSGSLSSVM
ncbi:alpha/beta fold hydrolase [Streptomyces sp. NPDC088770]|uniref:alpha/beta fold hydrolase n=1 Tax=Streptomyces sp. NPDC088770 TaxID=3365895 RepID=UPI00382BF8A3